MTTGTTSGPTDAPILREVKSVKGFGLFQDWTSDRGPHRFERRTVVFGANGSGKSSLVGAFRVIQEAQQGADTDSRLQQLQLLVDRANDPRIVCGNEIESLPRFVVFDAHYVRSNLRRTFENGEAATALYVLGENNARLDEAIATTEREFEELKSTGAELSEKERAAETCCRDVLDDVKKDVARELVRFDAQRYNPTKFNVTEAKKLLRGASADEASSSCLHDADLEIQRRKLEQTAESVGQDLVMSQPREVSPLRTAVEAVAAFNVTGQAIDQLAHDSELARWVHTGIALHEQRETCAFCDGEFTVQRRERLAAHFDDSYEELLHLMTRAKELLTRFSIELEEAKTKLEALDGQGEQFLAAVTGLDGYFEDASRFVQFAERTIEARKASPLASLPAPPLPELDLASWGVLSDLVAQENSRRQIERRDLDATQQAAAEAILAHIASSNLSAWKAAEAQLQSASAEVEEHKKCRAATEASLLELKGRLQSQHDGDVLAGQLTQDLVGYLGHAQISVRFVRTEDHAGFRFMRDGQEASDLSEGECNAIALLYFLTSLRGVEIQEYMERACVVIDDPVSSLDDDAAMSALAFINQHLCHARGELACAQLILLTHDFRFFRAWKDKLASHLDKASASLIEIRAEKVLHGEGHSSRRPVLCKVGAKHRLLHSEYFLLFAHACEVARQEPNDVGSLVLVGNATRRLLEAFISFKRPGPGPPTTAIRDLISETDSTAVPGWERLWLVLNDESHLRTFDLGQRNYSLRVIEDVRTALAFIRAADASHYEGMCQALDIESPL